MELKQISNEFNQTVIATDWVANQSSIFFVYVAAVSSDITLNFVFFKHCKDNFNP